MKLASRKITVRSSNLERLAWKVNSWASSQARTIRLSTGWDCKVVGRAEPVLVNGFNRYLNFTEKCSGTEGRLRACRWSLLILDQREPERMAKVLILFLFVTVYLVVYSVVYSVVYTVHWVSAHTRHAIGRPVEHLPVVLSYSLITALPFGLSSGDSGVCEAHSIYEPTAIDVRWLEN